MKNSESFITRTLRQESEKAELYWENKEKDAENDCISSWNNSFESALKIKPKKSGNSGKLFCYHEVHTSIPVLKKENRNKSERGSPVKLSRNIQGSLIDSSIILKIMETRRKGLASRVGNRAEVNKKNQETVRVI